MRGQAAPRSATATASGSLGTCAGGASAREIALSHHHPAHVFDDRLAALVESARAHIDDAALLVRVFLEADHLRDGGQRVARIDRLQEAAIGVAEIGDGVERDVGHGLAEHDMEREQVVDWPCGVADRASEGFRALRREARAIKRRIERGVAVAQRARRRMADRLAEAKILEEPACGGLGGRGAGHGGSKTRSDRRNR